MTVAASRVGGATPRSETALDATASQCTQRPSISKTINIKDLNIKDHLLNAKQSSALNFIESAPDSEWLTNLECILEALSLDTTPAAYCFSSTLA